MTRSLPTLDSLLHQPVRTRLVVALKANHEISFTDLKATLEVTDGNLDAHLKKLAAAGYLHTRFPSEGRMRTLFSLSESGAKEVDRYLKSLERLLNCI